MNEALREREERSRAEVEETRLLRVEAARLRERVASHAEVMREKERNVQVSFGFNLIAGKTKTPPQK
jgi:regulator of replication initiation timing